MEQGVPVTPVVGGDALDRTRSWNSALAFSIWKSYGAELARRTEDIVTHDL